MTPTLTRVDGFDHQIAATTAFSAGGNQVYSTFSNASYSNTYTKWDAGYSLVLNPDGATASSARWSLPAGTRNYVVSVYFRYNFFPIASTTLLMTGMATSANQMRVNYNISTGRLHMTIAASSTGGTAFGPVIELNKWYLLDTYYDSSSNTYTFKGRVNGDFASEFIISNSKTAEDISTIIFGSTNFQGTELQLYYDDAVGSATLSDYPIGHHRVELIKPISDGTHNGGTNVIEDQAGTNINGSYTTAYSLIDEVPAENTDYIKQVAAGSGNYAEVVFANPSATPWGTSYFCSIEGSGSNASDMLLRVVDSGGNTLLDQGGTGAVNATTRRYSVGYIAGNPTGNRGRIGFASDVAPVPRALMFVAQAAIPTGSGDTLLPGIPL